MKKIVTHSLMMKTKNGDRFKFSLLKAKRFSCCEACEKKICPHFHGPRTGLSISNRKVKSVPVFSFWGSQGGVTLFELLVAMIMLSLISTMIYSVLSVGISFSGKGEDKILAMEREQGLLNLLHRQIESAFFDSQETKVIISANGETLRLVTRNPIIYRNSGLVFAVYHYNPEDGSVYYAEKKDFYNVDYRADDYLPDIDEMRLLLQVEGGLSMLYDSDQDQAVQVEYNGNAYEFFPRCAKN